MHFRLAATSGSAASTGGLSPADKSKSRSTLKSLVSKEKLGGVFDDVPTQVLEADEVDLKVWAVLATDDSCRQLATLHSERLVKRRRTLRFSRADKISDVGAKVLGEALAEHLLHAEFSGCTKLTDTGLRALTMHSPNLLTLHLDGLRKLEGAGLSAVASTCSKLTSLSLSSCGQFEDWVYQAVARGCRDLRYLNLDNCPKVSDEAIKSFAKYCPHLRSLRIAECKQVSDVGLLQLSNHCTGLETLDLGRSELAFKVTDVSMLAFGERCHSLTELNVSGCQFLTDAGIDWLAGGCTSLTKLNLAGLFKLTDTSMLSLSERCPALKDLNISVVKKVSDVGLRYLSQGCRQLEILDATGCFLITDGKTRDFGLEGIQALCKVSPSLKSLKLAGCYNVGAIALASIGFGCRKLEFINLSSCPRVNAAGLGSLTKGCNLLTNICLRGCDKVEDDSLRAIARNAPQLLTINLSDIEGISDSGVAALVRGCKALQFITLKHCKGVSDLSLLAIAEANMNPGIRDLNLLGCYEVTDTGVSWLAERCPTIVCLNVLGCTVSRPGLRAMLHAWKHVSLRDDEHWLGPWPAERARELKFIEDFGDQWKAAQKFQSVVRGRRARKLAAAMRLENLKHWVVKRVQAAFRMRRARRAYILTLMKRRSEAEVVTKLQTRFRMKVARREREKRQQERFVRRCHEAATKMQKIFRGKRARDFMRMAREARLRYYNRCMEAASTIQRVFRGRKGRQTFLLAKAAQEALVQAKNEAALHINRLFRGMLGRRKANVQKQWWKSRREREEWAATYVQRHVRSLIARRVLQRLRADEELRNSAALWIQSRWRAHRGRLSAHLLAVARRDKRERDAATLVQKLWRGKMGRGRLGRMKAELAASIKRQEAAATSLQSIFRGFKDRKVVKTVKKQRMMDKLKLEDLFSWGAITIQRVRRGYVARNRVKELRIAHDRRWKEMWDDASGRPFFYDKNTGEVRWRRPQQLLNLMPRPICNNCDVLGADFECKDCCEFFCTTCFPQIHFGGKRKQHLFRPLFDTYGHRIDFGEGEWPSVWPSEIEQDEFQGWHFLNGDPHAGSALAASSYASGGVEDWSNASYTLAGGDDQAALAHYSAISSDAESSIVGMPTYHGQPSLDSGEAGWTKHWDEQYQREFYYHQVTGASSWERPLEYQSPRYSGQPVIATGNNGWTKHYDEMYFADFYHNEFTGETTWDRPQEYSTPRQDDLFAGASVASAASQWSQFWDDVNKRHYFYNASTGESSFDAPPGL